MSVQKMFSGFIEGFAAQLAGYGFVRGKGNIFRRHSPEGDVLVVELQVSSGSTPEAKLFYINIALVLAPKWERDRQQYRLPPTELPQHFHGTWRHRIGFDRLSGGDQWRINDEASALQVSDHVRRRLDETLPQLLPLLDREVLLGEAPEILGPGAWLVRAWLLAERGPSEELEHLLFVERPASTHNSVATRTVWAYANSRAENGRQ